MGCAVTGSVRTGTRYIVPVLGCTSVTQGCVAVPLAMFSVPHGAATDTPICCGDADVMSAASAATGNNKSAKRIKHCMRTNLECAPNRVNEQNSNHGAREIAKAKSVNVW